MRTKSHGSKLCKTFITLAAVLVATPTLAVQQPSVDHCAISAPTDWVLYSAPADSCLEFSNAIDVRTDVLGLDCA